MISEKKKHWLLVVDDLRDLYSSLLNEDQLAENNEIQVLADKLSIEITRRIECVVSDKTARGWLENENTLSDIRKDISNLKD